jgi:hypothetical protein
MEGIGPSLATSPSPYGGQEESTMSPTAIPARITIDFRDAVLPSRSWILGVDERLPARVDLIAFETPIPASTSVVPHRVTSSPARPRPLVAPAATVADCACPDFCERDHANE